MEFEQIESVLRDEEVLPVWEKTVSKWKRGSAEEKEALLGWMKAKRDFFLEVAEVVDDPEDRAMMMLTRYIETKSNWVQLNDLINFKLNNKGVRDEKAMYRASLLSRTLRIIETQLDQDELQKLTKEMSEPMAEEGFSTVVSAELTQDLIQDAFSDQQLMPEWNETFDALESLSEEDCEELRQWIAEIRDRFLDVSSEVHVITDKRHILAALYMEMKSAWVQFNNMMNYRMVNTGEFDEKTMARASLLTKLLEASETLMSEDEIYKLTMFLAHPFP